MHRECICLRLRQQIAYTCRLPWSGMGRGRVCPTIPIPIPIAISTLYILYMFAREKERGSDWAVERTRARQLWVPAGVRMSIINKCIWLCLHTRAKCNVSFPCAQRRLLHFRPVLGLFNFIGHRLFKTSLHVLWEDHGNGRKLMNIKLVCNKVRATNPEYKFRFLIFPLSRSNFVY